LNEPHWPGAHRTEDNIAHGMVCVKVFSIDAVSCTHEPRVHYPRGLSTIPQLQPMRLHATGLAAIQDPPVLVQESSSPCPCQESTVGMPTTPTYTESCTGKKPSNRAFIWLLGPSSWSISSKQPACMHTFQCGTAAACGALLYYCFSTPHDRCMPQGWWPAP